MRDRQFELPEEKEVLSLNALMSEWRCNSDIIYKAIADGMPYKRLPSGEYEFNLKECTNWVQFGWFNALPPLKKQDIFRRFGKVYKLKNKQ